MCKNALHTDPPPSLLFAVTANPLGKERSQAEVVVVMRSDATPSVKPTVIQSLGMKPSFPWTAHHSTSLPLLGAPSLPRADIFSPECELLLWGASELRIMSERLGSRDRSSVLSLISCGILVCGSTSLSLCSYNL